jgi:hypothetical protein
MYSVVVESDQIEESVKLAFQNKDDIALAVSRDGSKKQLETCSHLGRIHLFKEKGDERASRVDVPVFFLVNCVALFLFLFLFLLFLIIINLVC